MTRIINRPEQRLASGEVELRNPDQTDETNLTVGSKIEGRFNNRKEFGAWLDNLNSKLKPSRKGRRK